MFAENDADSAGDLFDDAPAAETPAIAHQCPSCGQESQSEKEIRYCSACGAPLHAAEGVSKVSVLLAEDATVSKRKVLAVLKNLGCVVVEAANGREAVDLARQVKPDLVILDLYMPQMNGLEALDALRADRQFKKTTIAMLTVEADASFVRDALSRGADDYIRKDSSPSELQKRLDKHIQKIRART
jgi:CheY-like chemotaxis protein